MPHLPELVSATADPALNNEIVFTAPEDLIVNSVYFTLVSDATGTPIVALVADDGNPANIFFKTQARTPQPISTTVNYCAHQGSLAQSLVGGNDTIVLDFPKDGLKLRAGDRLRTLTINLSGDDYGVMRLQVHRP